MEEEDEDDQLVADGRHVRHLRGHKITRCQDQLTLRTVLPPGAALAARGPKLLSVIINYLVYPSTGAPHRSCKAPTIGEVESSPVRIFDLAFTAPVPPFTCSPIFLSLSTLLANSPCSIINDY